jgi:SAM-dependent methyltransferase
MPNGNITRLIKTLSKHESHHLKAVAIRFQETFLNQAKLYLNRLHPYIQGQVLDIGVGSGGINSLLQAQGYFVVGVDIADISMFEQIAPIIYDGATLPFKSKEFDTALIVNVLHHCEDGMRVLSEAKRVANRVVIIEDTYRNKAEKMVVGITDAMMNGEFYSHPYYTVNEWHSLMHQQGWRMQVVDEWSQLAYGCCYGRYVMMVIE